jgi:hypothetical protein
MRPSTNIEDVREKEKNPQERIASGFGSMDPANMTPKGMSYGADGYQPADHGEGYTDDGKAGIPQGYAEGGTVKKKTRHVRSFAAGGMNAFGGQSTFSGAGAKDAAAKDYSAPPEPTAQDYSAPPEPTAQDYSAPPEPTSQDYNASDWGSSSDYNASDWGSSSDYNASDWGSSGGYSGGGGGGGYYSKGGTVKPRSMGDMRRARQVRIGSEIRPVRPTAPQAIQNVRGFAAGGIVPNTSGSATTTSNPATGGGYTGNPMTQPSATQAPVGPDQNQYGSWGSGTGEYGAGGSGAGGYGAPSSTGNVSATPGSTPASTPSVENGPSLTGGGYSIGGPFSQTGGINTNGLPGNNGQPDSQNVPDNYLNAIGVSFDEGGSVPDPGGAIPDDGDMQDTSTGDPGQTGDPSQTADQGDLMGTVMDALSAARKQYGLTDQMFAANIPSKPAGPGGDQPATNPFSTKTPSPPFGQASNNSGAIPTDENEAA